MKLGKSIEIIDLALLVGNNLIISDVHIGYEEYLNKKGVFVPRFQFKEVILRLEKIFDLINKIKKIKKIDKIIINGDVKHEFGRISEQEWRHTLRLIDFLKKHCNEIVLIKGNHDKILGPIAEKRNVKVVDYFVIKDVLLLHGHMIPDLTTKGFFLPRRNSKGISCVPEKPKVFLRIPLSMRGEKKAGEKQKKIEAKKIKTIIIGHEHPAVGLREAGNVETFKCYLKGGWKNKELIVMPSFNLVTEGSDVLKEKLLSPFLKNISDFEVFVVEDKVYDFGKVKNLYEK